MEEGEMRGSTVRERPTRGRQHRRRVRVERTQGVSSEGHDRLGTEELELPVEVRSAGSGRAPIEPVPRRPAFQEIEHSELTLREAESGNRPVQLAPRPTHEREAEPVLLRAGRLSDEDHSRRESSSVDDRVRP